MLDKNATSERLKAALETAFAAWQRADPRVRTKAEFARLTAQAAGRPCSPQTVGGWFKTGRMDKAWLPVVEAVLGAPLGFGYLQQDAARQAVPDQTELRRALELVSTAIRQTDEITRLSLEPLFAALVRKSEDSVQIAQRIEKMLGSSAAADVSPVDSKQTTASGVDFEMDADAERGKHGSSVSAEENQRSGPPVRGSARGTTSKR